MIAWQVVRSGRFATWILVIFVMKSVETRMSIKGLDNSKDTYISCVMNVSQRDNSDVKEVPIALMLEICDQGTGCTGLCYSLPFVN